MIAYIVPDPAAPAEVQLQVVRRPPPVGLEARLLELEGRPCPETFRVRRVLTLAAGRHLQVGSVVTPDTFVSPMTSERRARAVCLHLLELGTLEVVDDGPAAA